MYKWALAAILSISFAASAQASQTCLAVMKIAGGQEVKISYNHGIVGKIGNQQLRCENGTWRYQYKVVNLVNQTSTWAWADYTEPVDQTRFVVTGATASPYSVAPPVSAQAPSIRLQPTQRNDVGISLYPAPQPPSPRAVPPCDGSAANSYGASRSPGSLSNC